MGFGATIGLWALVVLKFIFYLFATIFWSIVYIFLRLASPCIYIGRLASKPVLVPLRFLERFEALWYFLLAAVATGALFALVCHFFLRIFAWLLFLDSKPPSPAVSSPPATGHDAISYRAARLAKKQATRGQAHKPVKLRLLPTSLPVVNPLVSVSASASAPAHSAISPGTKRQPLTRQTILEDSDEDESDW
ncbi:hypothetical protein DV738_g1537, partial [Chaetothyriales sp. CBS 135597]